MTLLRNEQVFMERSSATFGDSKLVTVSPKPSVNVNLQTVSPKPSVNVNLQTVLKNCP
jgi:hypothetical protein